MKFLNLSSNISHTIITTDIMLRPPWGEKNKTFPGMNSTFKHSNKHIFKSKSNTEFRPCNNVFYYIWVF